MHRDVADELIVVGSHRIHAHPELSFEEVNSSTWCADELERGGFDVTRHVAEIETAFVATVGIRRTDDRDLLRIRRFRMASVTRVGTTSSPRRPSVRASRELRSPTNSA